MPGLLGPNGEPISSAMFKKANPPALGEKFAPWAGRNVDFFPLPGGGMVNFDLNQLTLADFRLMRDHYQINASLCVLSFMLHQIDWVIECDDKKVQQHCETNMRELWSQLVRAMSQAFWAGYSPNVLQYENDVTGRTIQVTKVKDMVPEESRVHWRGIDQIAPSQGIKPKILIYDGIKLPGVSDHVPVENTFWYPLLMEHGNYYGRKLLRSAFIPWFFSNLIHLFSNRYFERFGEPVPVGRAPYGEEIDPGDGKMVQANEFMLQMMQQLRNRSVVVLPSDKTQVGMTNQAEYDYSLEYLESQMRGADFERYLSRLDEEMSLALFTPLLMLRTSDVGSYNLGVTHKEVYLWMLNAISADWKFYIDNFLLSRMVDFNFGVNAPRAKMKFRKLGQSQTQILQSIMAELTQQGRVQYDFEEIGQALGMSVEEIKVVSKGPDDPTNPDPNAPPPPAPTPPPAGGANPGPDNRVRTRTRKGTGPKGVGEPRATAKDVSARVGPQVVKAFKDKTFGEGFMPSLGFRKRFQESLRVEGFEAEEVEELTASFYARVETWLGEAIALGADEFDGPEAFMGLFKRVLENEVDRLLPDDSE